MRFKEKKMIENKITQIQFYSGLALAIFAANFMLFRIVSLSLRIVFLIWVFH